MNLKKKKSKKQSEQNNLMKTIEYEGIQKLSRVHFINLIF
jgi:hypothetical protein